MQFINTKNQNIFVYLVFLAIFLLGINIHKDYGTTIDDEFYRQNGEFYYQYIKALFFNSNLYGTNDLEQLSKIILGEGDGVIINHPVLFDNKYGNKEFNKLINTKTIKNIALHSKSIVFKDMSSKIINISAELPKSFNDLMNELK